MAKQKITYVDLDAPSTWVKYKKGMCRDCQALCCTMPVEMKLTDLVRMGIVDDFEAQEPPRQIAKRLKKERLIDHFNLKREIYTLARRANGDCIYLDFQTRQCTIYDKRPNICRNHPRVGPRPGYCAYKLKRKNPL